MQQVRPVIGGRSILLIALMILLFGVPVALAQDTDSGLFGPGDSYALTFDESGEFYYHCHPHPWMEGHVFIGPADGEPETHTVRIRGTGPEARFEPHEITVRLGDTVRWVNEGTEPHNVMGWFGGGGEAHSHDHPHGDGHDDGHTHESPLPAVVVLILGLIAFLAVLRRS